MTKGKNGGCCIAVGFSSHIAMSTVTRNMRTSLQISVSLRFFIFLDEFSRNAPPLPAFLVACRACIDVNASQGRAIAAVDTASSLV